MIKLGEVTQATVEASVRKHYCYLVILYRYFTVEPEVPEDTARNMLLINNQYLWDK